MRNAARHVTGIAFCMFTLVLAGCGSTSQTADDAEPTAAESSALEPLAATSAQEMDPRIVRLYNFEAQILGSRWAWEKGALLDQAMAEVATLLEREPTLIEDPDFREVYRGLAAEYRKYHDYAPNDTLETARGNIFAVRAELFRTLENVDQPLLEDVMPPREKPETIISMTDNRLVQQSIAYLQREPEKHFVQWQKRAGTYFPMIEHVLEEEGVPEELKYLAMIESGLNPQARSWASAVGMWQFMSHTGRGYGLRVNAWVDERRDPEKATRAAARHLRDLHNRFDDWHLALAAYNCGTGCVSRALRRSGAQDASYWDVYYHLPRETRGYVPMFIAAALVSSNPDAYEMPAVESDPAFAYDYVAVQGSMLSLAEIAELAGTSTSMLRALNPELRRHTLPPSEGHYFLRLPLGSYQEFATQYAQLPDEKKRPATTYTVRSGDTLGELAQQYGTSTRTLRRINSLGGTMIHVGQRLTVPVASYESALSEEMADANPRRVQYEASFPIQSLDPLVASADTAPSETSPFRTASHGPSSDDEAVAQTDEGAVEDVAEETRAALAEIEEEPAPEAEASTSSRPETYRVRRGDTLIEIADRFDLWVADLRKWNGVTSDMLRIGQELRLHPPEEPPEEEARAASSEEEVVTYRVRSGDTIDRIARAHGVSVRDIMTWNGLSGSRIMPGQQLEIHTSESGDGPRVHVVQRGQNLSVIAQVHGVSVQQLRQWNDLSSNNIYPGQRLVVSQ